jgi:hypothetical protein
MVSFGAAILNKLHGKTADRGEQEGVYKPAFVQDQFLKHPDSKKE